MLKKLTAQDAPGSTLAIVGGVDAPLKIVGFVRRVLFIQPR